MLCSNFTFPPPTAAVTSEEKDEILAQELQVSSVHLREENGNLYLLIIIKIRFILLWKDEYYTAFRSLKDKLIQLNSKK